MRRLALALFSVDVVAAVAAAALSGCAIPDSQFEATGDAGPGADGGMSLSIVPSAAAVELAEGGEAELMITLSQPPPAPLTVSIATSSGKLALGAPELVFTAESYAQPQRLTLTGLADADTVAEQAELTLSAPSLPSVTVKATIADDDVLALVTNIDVSGVVSINEAGSSIVRVHLSAQPSGDVRVEALLAAGPASVNGPTSRTFTAQNYDVDQIFTFSAADDANITSEDIALTLRGPGVPDKGATLRTVDDDSLNLAITPSSLEVTEQGAAGAINVSLTQQPAADVTVAITTTTGQAEVSLTQLTFTSQNYATARRVDVTGRDDANTVDGSDTIRFNAAGLTERTAAITIRDNDTQQLLVAADNPHLVAENGTAAFSVTLRYQPTADVVVSVTSLAAGVATAAPGVLRFTSANYATPHDVTVRGTDDNNLVANTTAIRLAEAALGQRDVPVSVSDDDTQRFVVSATTLSIPEGTTKFFDVSLAYDPGAAVAGTVVSSDAAALPISASALTFTSANYATPVRITVAPPADSNTVSETSTITMSGCGAPATASVLATAVDSTMLRQYGWPVTFPGTTQIPRGMVIAYRINVDATTSLDSFGLWVPAAVGDFRMALYADVGAAPAALVAQVPARRALVNGVNTIDITPDVQLPTGNYWVVLRVAQATAVGYSAAGVTGSQCVRTTDLPNLDDPWPTAFGASSCTTTRLLNLWINNYLQP